MKHKLNKCIFVIILALLYCNTVLNSNNTNNKDTEEGDLTDVFATKCIFEDYTSADFEQYGCKVYYKTVLRGILLRSLQLSSLKHLVFSWDDWRLWFAISHDKFKQFVIENNIPLQNTNIQNYKEGNVIYNTTIDLEYPFTNIPIQYVISKGHYEYNMNTNCVEVFFQSGQETARRIMYKTFSEINDTKYIEFRNNYIKQLLNVNYKTLNTISKQNIEDDENGETIVPANCYFLKIVEMIDYYGTNFLKKFINIIKNDKNISIKEKRKILNMYAKYYKKQKNNIVSNILESSSVMG